MISPSWFLVPSTFSTGTGFISLDKGRCLSRAQPLSTKHPVAPLSSRASTSIVFSGPLIRTGILTSRSIVTVLRNSTGKTSELPAGLSGSSDAKTGKEESSPDNGKELSTLDLTSGAEPIAGTPLEEVHTGEETKEAVVSAQSVVH